MTLSTFDRVRIHAILRFAFKDLSFLFDFDWTSSSPSRYCKWKWQLWGSNPRPYGLAPEASALDHSAKLSLLWFAFQVVPRVQCSFSAASLHAVCAPVQPRSRRAQAKPKMTGNQDEYGSISTTSSVNLHQYIFTAAVASFPVNSGPTRARTADLTVIGRTL